MSNQGKAPFLSVGALFAFMFLAVPTLAQVNGEIEVAEALLVDLDASIFEIGPAPEQWENIASETIGDFQVTGTPRVVERDGVISVMFNEDGRLSDGYVSILPAPASIRGPDPTRSIEIWAWNQAVSNNSPETMVSWGRFGGPDGTGMAFNYNSSPAFGAVFHYGEADIGWNDGGGAPRSGEWHHLAYTFDGETTRVYTDGCVDTEACDYSNEERLGFGRINTHPGKIRIAQMTDSDGERVFASGSLAVARLRIHDGVLSDEQIMSNYEAEASSLRCRQRNDFCRNARELVFVEGVDAKGAVVLTTIAAGRTTCSTTDWHNSEDSECGASTAPDVWYFVTGNGRPMRAETCGSDYDTWLSIFEGGCGNLVCVTENDDACGHQSSTSWNTEEGVTYLILVHGFQTSAGEYMLSVSTPLPEYFSRGDANADGGFDISDVSYVLNFLFLGAGAPLCYDAVDVNDDGRLDLSDAVSILNRLFLGGLEIPPPGVFDCGTDPTEDGFDCERFPSCEN